MKLPRADQDNPGAFLSQILTSYIDPPLIGTGARVKINEKAGTIVFGANVQISPVVISTQGLTITTITPPIEATVENPQIEQSNWVAVDPENRGGTKLADLLNALKQLRVEAKDRIAIIKGGQILACDSATHLKSQTNTNTLGQALEQIIHPEGRKHIDRYFEVTR